MRNKFSKIIVLAISILIIGGAYLSVVTPAKAICDITSDPGTPPSIISFNPASSANSGGSLNVTGQWVKGGVCTGGGGSGVSGGGIAQISIDGGANITPLPACDTGIGTTCNIDMSIPISTYSDGPHSIILRVSNLAGEDSLSKNFEIIPLFTVIAHFKDSSGFSLIDSDSYGNISSGSSVTVYVRAINNYNLSPFDTTGECAEYPRINGFPDGDNATAPTTYITKSIYETNTTDGVCEMNFIYNKIPMSGTLSSPDCTISAGASSCSVNLSWGITNPEATPTAITATGMSNINVTNTLTTPQSGTQSATVPYPSRTFYLYNNAKSLAQDTQTATCALNTTWNGTICETIVTPCTNGATNPPTCDTCASGYEMVGGTCTSVSPSGTLNASSCLIALNESTCTSTVSGTTSHLPSGSTTEITRDNPSDTHVAWITTTSFSVPNDINFGTSNFYLYNSGSIQYLASDPATASCTSGTTWDDIVNKCVSGVGIINGSCGTTHYNCTAGTSGAQQGLDDAWAWICFGIGTGSTNDYTCSEPAPNLTAGAITPITATANVAQAYNATISNIGTASTGDVFPYFFQKATDASGAGASDISPSKTMSTLVAGASSTATSPSFPLSATSYLRVCADKNSSADFGSIDESNEGNNCGPWTLVTVSAPVTIPTVTTTSCSNITATTATSGGNVTSDGGASVTGRGVAWSTASNPTIALSTKTSDGSGTGVFTSSMTSLTPITTYHVRAYATNSVGTAYGADVTCITPAIANNASCTSITAPATVTAGQTFSATVVMQNSGSKTWDSVTADATSPHRLGTQNPADTTRWMPLSSGYQNRIDLPSLHVNSGSSATFSFTATAPSTSGTYPFEWKMVEEGVEWFGAECTKSITVNPSAGAPDLTAGAVTPTTATINTPVTFSSTISNIGDASTGAGFSNLFQVADASNTIIDLGPIVKGVPSMSTLGAGASATATRSYTFTSAGTYQVRACADKSNSASVGVIAESNEDNNCSPSWTNITVTATPVMSGTLTASNCEIASGFGSCDSTLNWGIANTEAIPSEITSVGMTSMSLSTPTIGGTYSGTKTYTFTSPSSRTFYLYNNAKSLVPTSPSGSGVVATATCVSGTGWDGSKCAVGVVCEVNQGNNCTSSPNSCGLTGSGTIACDGSCSAVTPPESSCDSISTVTLSNTTVANDGTTTLSWTTQNIVSESCVADASVPDTGWYGSKPDNGSQAGVIVTAIAPSCDTYSITCTSNSNNQITAQRCLNTTSTGGSSTQKKPIFIED